MAGKQSIPMTKVQRLIEGGMSAPDAARQVGIAVQSVYLRPWWKAMQAAKAEQQKTSGGMVSENA